MKGLDRDSALTKRITQALASEGKDARRRLSGRLCCV